jgi:hypothetical protein
MSFEVRKVKEDNTSITLGWDPVAGADGYRFFSAGVLRSETMDPARTTVKFSKGQEPYVIEAVHLNKIDSGKYPAPPTPAFKKVAPITVREEGGSDQRVCLFEGGVEGGPLRPGVVDLGGGKYTDESGAIYQSNGLEDSSLRTKVHDTALVGARSMDGRNACQCPPTGDPTKNTGSWTI